MVTITVIIISGQKNYWMLNIIDKIGMRNGILYNFKASPYRLLTNYKGGKSNFTENKPNRHHSDGVNSKHHQWWTNWHHTPPDGMRWEEHTLTPVIFWPKVCITWIWAWGNAGQAAEEDIPQRVCSVTSKKVNVRKVKGRPRKRSRSEGTSPTRRGPTCGSGQLPDSSEYHRNCHGHIYGTSTMCPLSSLPSYVSITA